MDTSLKLRLLPFAVLLSCAAAFTGWCILVKAQNADVNQLTAQSNPEIQERIYTTLNATETNSAETLKQLDSLKKIDHAEIVKQLAIFVARADAEDVLRARRILDLLNSPPAAVIKVLAPHLNADNPNLRSFVRDWFQHHDKVGAPGRVLPLLQPVNYNDYKDYVRGKVMRSEEIPEPFIEYIYERLPSYALLIFYNAYGQKDRAVLLADHVIRNAIWLRENGFKEDFQKTHPEAKSELLKLSKHEEWWVRLYVAEIMRQHADLREPIVVSQLAGDSNDLVAKAAKKESKPARPINTGKRAEAYKKLQKMIDARKAAPNPAPAE